MAFIMLMIAAILFSSDIASYILFFVVYFSIQGLVNLKKELDMKIVVLIINSAAASIVTTLIILTVSFLILLFSSAELGYRTAYFGAVFFNSAPTSSDTIGMTFGINNVIPIIVTVAIFTVVYYFVLQLIAKNR
jgi:hypothetical protein